MTATMTKERPILFKGPLVRAILDGKKTVTRRIVKMPPWDFPEDTPGQHQKEFHHGTNRCWPQKDGSFIFGLGESADDAAEMYCPAFSCPFGVPGDRLWVREAFTIWDDERKVPVLIYREDETSFMVQNYTGENGSECLSLTETEYNPAKDPRVTLKWKPSIFMPRWASRLTLEVVSVRVERLQEISIADIAAEGVVKLDLTAQYIRSTMTQSDLDANTRHLFSLGWDKINVKRGSWVSNPWVWRIEFKRV